MLTDERAEKHVMYHKMMEMFEKGFPSVEKHKVPYEKGYLPCISIGDFSLEKTLLIHDGYDSFIEEFYLVCEQFFEADYRVLLFEGKGQGETLRQNMKFYAQWENSVGAILDYFKVNQAGLIGILWGGLLALRSAAFDRRITHVINYGGCYDGLDVQLSFMKELVKNLFKSLFYFKFKRTINRLVSRKMKEGNLVNCAISHGMYITGTTTPYAFYRSIEKHTLKGHLPNINQQVLLLAGENDHYIPSWQHACLVKHLSAADVTGKVFTKTEGGEQHCQVGNYELAVGTILNWLKEKYAYRNLSKRSNDIFFILNVDLTIIRVKK